MAGNKWRFRGGQQRFTHLNPYPSFQQTQMLSYRNEYVKHKVMLLLYLIQ